MVSFKALSALALGLFAVSTGAAPVEGEAHIVDLAARDGGYSRGGTGTGKIWYSTFTGATTACGFNYAEGSTDDKFYGALKGDLWNNNEACGKTLTVQFDNNKAAINVTIVDTCSGCDLLLSKAAFESSGLGIGAGRIFGQWKRVN